MTPFSPLQKKACAVFLAAFLVLSPASAALSQEADGSGTSALPEVSGDSSGASGTSGTEGSTAADSSSTDSSDDTTAQDTGADTSGNATSIDENQNTQSESSTDSMAGNAQEENPEAESATPLESSDTVASSTQASSQDSSTLLAPFDTASTTEGIPDGNAVVDTGNAVATADVVTVANSNFFNSSIWILFLNNFFRLLTGDIDVRSILASDPNHGVGDGAPACDSETSTCLSEGSLTLSNDNTADIENDIIVRSGTGENGALGGDAGIGTGDAAAAANVVNLANLNVVDSNFILLTINNFSDWVGDFILPTADSLASLAAPIATPSTTTTTLLNQNEAGVENNVSSTALSGDNTASAPSAAIDTGVSAAWSNIVNTLNQNLVGGTTLYLVFRVHGDWVGDVWNAPDGVTWTEKDGVVEIGGAIPGLSETFGTFRDTTIDNANAAAIRNNISVSALTGLNHATGTRSARISTGNAVSIANVVNMANTNVYGKNWIVAIVNIFGNWRGNISFGRPNLWIGSRAVVTPSPSRPDRARPGSPVTYHHTITNNGDAPAHKVVIRQKIEKLLAFTQADRGGSYDPASGFITWEIPSLAPGETTEVSSTATLGEDVPPGDSVQSSAVDVSAQESDGNIKDNAETVDVVVYRIESYGGPYRTSNSWPRPEFNIRKSAQFATTSASSTLGYRIAVKNTGGPAKDAVLMDAITDEEGKTVRIKKWNIGSIASGEEIRVEYDVLWSSTTKPGHYTNTAQLQAVGGYPQYGPGPETTVYSGMASTTIEVVGGELEEVPMTLATTEPDLPMTLLLAETSQPMHTLLSTSVSDEERENDCLGQDCEGGGETLVALASVDSLNGDGSGSWDLSKLLAGLGSLSGNPFGRAAAPWTLSILATLLLMSLYFRRKENGLREI